MVDKVICVGSLGDYRHAVVTHILGMTGSELLIIAGDQPIEPTVRVLDLDHARLKRVRNIFLFGRKITIQMGGFYQCLQASSLIVDLNPRSLSVWAILILRRIVFRRTVVWGHAWPRRGADAASDVIRGVQRKLAGNVLVYTQTQANELLRRYPKLHVVAASNAIYSAKMMRALPPTRKDGLDIIYVGRLVAEKKPSLLLEAFMKGAHELPAQTRLVFVGAGPELARMKEAAKGSRHADRICFKGHVTDPVLLESLYRDALFSVSPGYVGLSITQSFGFGVAMLISRDERHSPEIEAAIEGVNAKFFQTDSVDDLVRQMGLLFSESDYWISQRTHISKICSDNYSAENMAMNILGAL